jgi:hypothetical protein
MPGRNLERVVAAARDALLEGERVVEYGPCWAAERRRRVPLLLLRRQQRLLMLTDRRLLLFSRRRRRGLRPSNLVVGKGYAAFSVERVRRVRPLLQVRVQATNGPRMVLEFRPGRRPLGEALLRRLDAQGQAPSVPTDPDGGQAGGEDAGGADPPRRGS